MLWLDADNRLIEMSAAKKWIEQGRIIPWTIDHPLIEDSLRARQLSTQIRKNLITSGPPKKQPQGYPQFLDHMDNADKFIIEHDIRTVVIDPGTRVVEHMIRYLEYMTKTGVVERGGWGIYLSNLEEIINKALAFPNNVNLVMTFHSREYIDEDSGRVTETLPLLSGQMQAKVAAYFGEVWFTKVEVVNQVPQFLLQCQPSATIQCRTSRGLELTEPSHIPTLMKKPGWGDKKFTLMIYGPPGTGKTSTALTLCEVEDDEPVECK